MKHDLLWTWSRESNVFFFKWLKMMLLFPTYLLFLLLSFLLALLLFPHFSSYFNHRSVFQNRPIRGQIEEREIRGEAGRTPCQRYRYGVRRCVTMWWPRADRERGPERLVWSRCPIKPREPVGERHTSGGSRRPNGGADNAVEWPS